MAATMDAKLLRATKFPPEFNQKVDMQKVNLQVMKKWIASRISEILGSEDDVVIELCFNLIDGPRFPDIKSLQIQLTGFLDKDTAPFCKELWKLCLSAQSSPQGVPKELLEAKKLELIQEKPPRRPVFVAKRKSVEIVSSPTSETENAEIVAFGEVEETTGAAGDEVEIEPSMIVGALVAARIEADLPLGETATVTAIAMYTKAIATAMCPKIVVEVVKTSDEVALLLAQDLHTPVIPLTHGRPALPINALGGAL
ncbi:PWI domain-containing protein [Nemania sp. FL0916]|nr:PWI domain-containing protein [Nemania sp. FL0916]